MIALKLDQNIRIVFSIVNNWLIKKQKNTFFYCPMIVQPCRVHIII